MTPKSIVKNGVILLALATISISQPILDLYGKNLPIFATAKVSELEVALFIFIVAFVPTVIALVVQVVVGFISVRYATIVHYCFVSLLCCIFGLAITRQFGLSQDIVALGVSVLIGAAITAAIFRVAMVRTFVSYVAVLAPLLVGVFVLQVQPVFGKSSEPILSSTTAVTAPPIVLIVFDESPLFALLDSSGNINAERFPGFAKLASLSTWHRNATAVSQHTTQAVPAIFTSNIPKRGDQPFLSVHPDNIFTMLQTTYPINGYESVTSLCPIQVCASTNPTDLERLNAPRLKTFLKDASVVFGHRILPKSLRNKLPAIGESWGRFSVNTGAENKSNKNKAVGADDKFDLTRAGGPFFQLRMFNEAIDRLAKSKTNSATILHLIAPHRPWLMLPDLRKSTAPPFLGDLNLTTGSDTRVDLQRYLYQLGAVDSMISSLIRRMQKAGLWDRSLVVITADHGISFEPGLMKRSIDFSNAGQVTDLFTIPMFIKMPNQEAGAVDDCAVTNLDLLPTILDVSGVRTQAHLEGVSLRSQCPVRDKRPMTTTKDARLIASSFEQVMERSNRYAKWLSREGALNKIAGLANEQGLLGTLVTTNKKSSAVTAWHSSVATAFENIKPGIGQITPTVIYGDIDIARDLAADAKGLVLVDGKVAGVVDELAGAKAGKLDFLAVLDYTLLTKGPHQVSLVMYSTSGGIGVYELVGPLEK
ncbi:MAG: hypothetical protein EXQ63_01220 [Ilumatobacteraceae bacterium]|nr:hypothetical protein [Ilumatobacteraceae bacterium]